ncbi:MAG: bifunctional folylpolyglutamate synthase/dihydrofolate synthase, partial [Lachnospiraceae bacterium]|nr:bifunctional folylpolyglutamate synthase/dihydrofolate synthase [Lachnospiraceae bacterium]
LLHKDPVFILDGAHNGHGVNACVDSLISLFASKKIVYILGMLNDKDRDKMLEKLYINAKSFIILTPSSSRALTGRVLAETISKRGFTSKNCASTKEAIAWAFREASEDGIICTLGSLYLAGEVKACMESVSL